MKIAEITDYLESIAPIGSQESYDNSGLLIGNKNTEITNALISLDCTESIVDEAINKKCNLIISHHPLIFKGIKKLTGKNYVERTLIKAIKNDIAIYAIHTNLDNYQFGVNKKIGNLLGIKNPEILAPSTETLAKLVVYTPHTHQTEVSNALFNAGAGHIGNYSECSFSTTGQGTFKANLDANPHVGKINERHHENETRIEVIVSVHRLQSVIKSMLKAHPYEEAAYDIFPMLNQNKYEGAGMFGQLETAIPEHEFLTKLKSVFSCKIIRHSNFLGKPIQKIAWCGGSGFFLLQAAKKAGADIFITGDVKYHDFFDSDNQIVISDIGHFESEQFTIELINDLIQKKFPTFAPCLTEIVTNPIYYF